jgi:beta-lactamase class A
VFAILLAMRLALLFFLLTSSVSGQTPLQDEIRKIALDARGKVAVACSLPGSSLNCDLEAHSRPPMQSVFKMPLAVYALHLVEQGKFSLDQPIRFLPSDRILPETYSPLQDKYPNAEVDVPLRELLRLAASLSDNAAADTVLRVAGGPAEVDAYIKSLGVQGFHLEDGEHALHRDASTGGSGATASAIERQLSAYARAHRTAAGLDEGFTYRRAPHKGWAARRNDRDA